MPRDPKIEQCSLRVTPTAIVITADKGKCDSVHGSDLGIDMGWQCLTEGILPRDPKIEQCSLRVTPTATLITAIRVNATVSTGVI